MDVSPHHQYYIVQHTLGNVADIQQQYLFFEKRKIGVGSPFLLIEGQLVLYLPSIQKQQQKYKQYKNNYVNRLESNQSVSWQNMKQTKCKTLNNVLCKFVSTQNTRIGPNLKILYSCINHHKDLHITLLQSHTFLFTLSDSLTPGKHQIFNNLQVYFNIFTI